MLYIEKGSETVLPEKYHIAHNYCVEIYDMIHELHKNEIFKDLFVLDFEIKRGENLVKIKELEDGGITGLDWLLENNKLDVLEKILCKRLLVSITGDMLNFIYAGLSCSMKGITNVAYANFRKPLKDNLTLLEMILIEPTEFTRKYYIEGNPKNYDPSSKKIDKKEILEKVFKKLGDAYGSTHKEIIYTLRFDKTNPHSFDPLSNLALHIVTRDKNYKTEDKNLNFIFSTEEDLESPMISGNSISFI